jgi:hypothetical protein
MKTENMASYNKLLIVVQNGAKCTMMNVARKNNAAFRHTSSMPAGVGNLTEMDSVFPLVADVIVSP